MAEMNALPGSDVKRLTRCETTSVLKQAELTWTIRNFAFKCQNQGNLKAITSPSFHAEGNENIKWYLSLRPNGKEEENKTWMSLFLQLKSSSKAPQSPVNFWLSIGHKRRPTASGRKSKEDAKDRSISPGKGRGFSKFVREMRFCPATTLSMEVSLSDVICNMSKNWSK